MVIFRNNNRGSNFRRNDRNYKRNGEASKFKSHFPSKDGFQRKVPSRNNYNASKLVEKYNDLAREALANEDKILSENYFQYADHFTRVLSEQEKNRPIRTINNSTVEKSEIEPNQNKEISSETEKEPKEQIVSS